MNDLNRARIRLEQHKTNHILHLLLSFFTIGIWIIFWMMIAISNTINRNVINRKYGLPEESNLVGSGCLLLIVLFIMGAVVVFLEFNEPNETPSEDSFIDLASNPFTNPQDVKSVINQPVQQLAQTTDHNNSIVKHDVKSSLLTNQNVLKASCYDLKPDFNDCEYKANKGSSVAQYNLGKLYRAGTVVEQDFTKAILWFRKSSAQRNHKALNALRDMLHKKQGFSDDGVNESKENNRQVLHRSKIVQRTTGDKTNKREPGDGYSVADATVAVGSLNAARSAKQYLRTSGFSRKGLIKQLSSDYGDGYNVADATVAVGSLNIDWDKQAARSAKQYLRTSGFSCKGLIKQLSSDYGDGYTVRQATYGARQAGAC